jgi:WD40 repeat protein
MRRAVLIGIFALIEVLGPPLSLGVEVAPAAKGPVAKKVAVFHDGLYVSAMAFNHDGSQLALNFMVNGADVHVWNWRKPSRLAFSLRKPAGTGDGRGLSYSPDGALLAVKHLPSDGRIVTIWDAHSGAVLHDILQTQIGDGDGGFAFSPDGKFFLRTVTRALNLPGDQLVVHRTDTWEPVWSLRTMPFGPSLIAVAPDSTRAVLGGGTFPPWPRPPNVQPLPSPAAIVVVDLVSHSIIRTIRPAGLGAYRVSAVAWSPDGRQLAAGVVAGDKPGPDALEAFDASTGEKIGSVESQLADVTGLAYSPNGRYLIAGSIDKSVRIMDATTLALLQRVSEDARVIAISPDSRYLAISEVRDISVWRLR